MKTRILSVGLVLAVVVLGPAGESRLLAQAQDEKAVHVEQQDPVSGLIFAPDGRAVTSLSGFHWPKARPWTKGQPPYTLRSWEAAKGGLLKQVDLENPEVEGHSQWCYSPDRKLFGATTSSGLHLWATNTGKRLTIYKSDLGASWIGFSQDGKIVTAIDPWGVVMQWDIRTGKKLPDHRLPDKDVYKVNFCAGTNLLAAVVGKFRDAVLVWDAIAAKEVHRLKFPEAYANFAVLAPDGRSLAIMAKDLHLYDVATEKKRHRFTGGVAELPPPVRSASLTKTRVPSGLALFAPDGKQLALVPNTVNREIGGSDSVGLARLWDVDTGKLRHEFRLELPGDRILCLAFSDDGKTLAAGCASGTLLLWDLGSGGLP